MIETLTGVANSEHYVDDVEEKILEVFEDGSGDSHLIGLFNEGYVWAEERVFLTAAAWADTLRFYYLYKSFYKLYRKQHAVLFGPTGVEK